MSKDIRVIQEYSLEILKYIDKVCKANDIKYILIGGTLLGAVRHNGFIPWDDDIDIAMTRDNFKKFLKVMEKDSNTRYKLCCIQNEIKWTAPLAKVIDTHTILRQVNHREKMDLGIYVDVFIIDKNPESLEERKIWRQKIDLYQKIWSACECKNRFKRKKSLSNFIKDFISLFITKIIDARTIAKWIDKEAGKYNNISKSNVLSSAIFRVYSWERSSITVEMLGKGCELEFEGEYFSCPEKYHEYLTCKYGDYMQLPPVEQRVSHHNFTLEILDE